MMRLALILLISLATATMAAPLSAATPPTEPPVAEAGQASEAPVVDGDVLGDPAWAGVEPLTGFWQTTPDAGSPASERTEVRILYTETVLYFGVICFDDDPSGIIVNESRRDSPLDETDSFQIILDTYLDRQNGFVFGTNPTGLEYDGQVTNEGEGGRGLGSSLGGLNLNWNGAWTVRTLDRRFRLERGVRHPLLDPPLRPQGDPGLGDELPAEHPPPQRAVVLGARCRDSSTSSGCPRPAPSAGLEPPRQRNLQILPYVRGDAARGPGARASSAPPTATSAATSSGASPRASPSTPR